MKSKSFLRLAVTLIFGVIIGLIIGISIDSKDVATHEVAGTIRQASNTEVNNLLRSNPGLRDAFHISLQYQEIGQEPPEVISNQISSLLDNYPQLTRFLCINCHE